MKKIFAILLALSIAFTLGIPAFAAEEESAADEITQEEILEIVQSEEFKDVLEEEGIDSEEIEGIIKEGDYTVVEESGKKSYPEKVVIVAQSGLSNIGTGLLFIAGGSLFNLPTWIIPPIGASLLLAGLPLGLIITVAGLGELVGSPIIAIFSGDNYSFRLI